MSDCKACGGRATLFICGRCTTKLRSILDELPGWLDSLAEAAIGQVRLTDGGRGSTRREPFKGPDGTLALCKCGHPEHAGLDAVDSDGRVQLRDTPCGVIDYQVIMVPVENPSDDPDEPNEVEQVIERPCRCTEYRPAADQARVRAQFLAAGRINARAADMLDEVRNSLITWTRHIAEARGMGLVRPGFIGPLLAGDIRLAPGGALAFLTRNVMAIASDEAAGECLAELERHVAKIERLIDRPLAIRFLGPCRTFNEVTRKTCGTQLQCREDVVEVTCPNCRHIYNANHLQSLTENDLEHKEMTVKQILEYNRQLPEEYRIHERRLRRWRKPGKHGEPPRLKPCGYRRGGEDGPLRPHKRSDADEPVYRWSDVKRLRAERPGQRADVG